MSERLSSCPSCGNPLTPQLLSGQPRTCPHCQQTQTLLTPADRNATLSLLRNDSPQASPETVDDVSSIQRRADLPAKIGRFEIRRQLGEGGFGVVYEAYDPQLDRLVALKVAKLGHGDVDQRVKRFLREAKAAANLRHPNIVPVHEYGQDQDNFYIAMGFVKGKTLAADLKEEKPRDLMRAARTVRQMAEALAYAHRQGIIHRDIKPLNTMLAEDDQPLIMDFGLAAREEDEKLTREGAAMGTAAYMAPEQAQGKSVAASDQYSLGCTLYQMLTGETPFAGPWDVQIFNHLQTEPPSPCKSNPAVSRDLKTICLKCLEKEPARRYSDCQALADDLRRYTDGEPISARRVGTLERAAKWCRKNPLSASLLGTVAAVLLLGTVVAWVLAGWALREAELAKKNENSAQWKVYAGNIALAQSAWHANQTDLVHHYLGICGKRGWEHDFLWTLIHSNQKTLGMHRRTVTSVAFSPDGKRILSSGGDKSLTVWDVGSGQKILTLHDGDKKATSVIEATRAVFSPDGKRIVGTSDDNTLKVWDANSGQEIRTLKGHTGVVYSVCFSPDGKKIVSGSGDKTLKVWDAASGQEIQTLKGHTDFVFRVVFSPDGERIVSSSNDKTLMVWDAASGQKTLTLRGIIDRHWGVSHIPYVSGDFSPDGKRIIGGCDNALIVWDAASGQETFTVKGRHTGFVTGKVFSPDGKRLVDGTLKVREAGSGREILTLKGHTGSVTRVAFSPDGKRIVGGSLEGTLEVWDAGSGEKILTLKGHTNVVEIVTFSPDGKKIASGGSWMDDTVKVWDADGSQGPLTLKGHTNEVKSVAFSPDGKKVVSGSWDSTLKVWDAGSSHEPLTIKNTNQVYSVAFSPDGKRIASGSGDNTLKVWDAGSGQETLTLKGHTRGVQSVAFSPDGTKIVTGDDEGILKVWDATSGQETLTLKGTTGSVQNVAFSPDSKKIVSCTVGFTSSDGTSSDASTLKVWDAASGQETLTLKEHATCVAFSPDGKRIVSGIDKTLKVWDVTSGRETLNLQGHTGYVTCVAFSPDGKRIVSGSGRDTRNRGDLKLWDAISGQETLTLKAHAGDVNSVAFSSDGKKIVSGSADGTLKVWDASMSKAR